MIMPEIVDEKVTTSPTNGHEIDLVEMLRNQNLFQRLGFSHNRVNDAEVRQAYEIQLAKLAGCRGQINEVEIESAFRLIEAAYQRLATSHDRADYTKQLSGHKEADRPAERPDSSRLFLGRYQVQANLSHGARCRLDIALDTRLRRQVVIKRPLNSATKEHTTIFRREAELFAAMTSPYLVKLLDYDAASGALVMEKLTGNAKLWPKNKPWPATKVHHGLCNALLGLMALHQKQIIHGRIDLTHLLLDDLGNIKLSLTPGMAERRFAMLPGAQTRHVAPELLNSHAFGSPTEATDLYALGFAMLELLVGPELEKLNVYDNWLSWHATSTEHLPDIGDLCPGVGGPLIAVLNGMCRKHPQDRIGNAEECYRQLTQKDASDRSDFPATTRHAFVNAEEDKELENSAEESVVQFDTPYALEEEYADVALEWRQILHRPMLLFTWKAKNYWLAACMILVAAIALLLVLSARTSNSPQTPIASPSPSSPTNELGAPDREPREFNNSDKDITPVAAPLEQGPQTSADSADYSKHINALSSWTSSIGNLFTSALENRPQRTELPEFRPPTPPAMPLMNEEIEIFPIQGDFEAGNPAKQMNIIRRLIRQVHTLPLIRDEVLDACVAEIQHLDVDPRITYALALLAFEKSEFELASQLCERSWSDGLRNGIVFPAASLLHSRVMIQNGKVDLALHQLCLDLLTLASARNSELDAMDGSPRAVHLTNARLLLVKRVGQLLGFVEHTSRGTARIRFDLDSLLQRVQLHFTVDEEAVFHLSQQRMETRAEKLRDRVTRLNDPKFDSTPARTSDAKLLPSESSSYASLPSEADSSVGPRPLPLIPTNQFNSFVPLQPEVLKARILRSLPSH